MGHRANFVLIRGNAATAYYDQWAALGSTYAFAGGPAEAIATAEMSQPVQELLDWAFAEAGFLLDFDEKCAIVFGYPEPVDLEPEALEGLEGIEGVEGLDDLAELAQGASAQGAELDAALQQGPLEFLRCIAPRWPGWLLHWDENGVDAFAVYLERRGILGVAVQPPSPGAGRTQVSFQA